MTDRYKGLLVALEGDLRDDDAVGIIAAIRQLRGVLDVQPVVAVPEDWITRTRVRTELIRRLYEVLE